MMLRLGLPAIFLGSACASSGTVNLTKVGQHDADDYSSVRSHWTRDLRLLKDLDTTLRVRATLLSPDFDAAYLAKYKGMFRMPEKESQALAASLRTRHADQYHFILSVATHHRRHNDLERPNSTWRIYLQSSDGPQLAPAKIVKEKAITPTLRELFPYVGPFHMLYRVQFPRTLPGGAPLIGPKSSSLVLGFAGPLGQGELTWRIAH